MLPPSQVGGSTEVHNQTVFADSLLRPTVVRNLRHRSDAVA